MRMQSSERRMRNAEWNGALRPNCRHSAPRTSHAAFTLIELMVALGLMALLMMMISTIFTLASRSFQRARALVEIHQNARAAFDMMLRDLAAATLCEYEDKSGYFALSWRPEYEARDAVQTLTFTSVIDPAGAEPIVEGVSPQLALVRYTLAYYGDEPATDDEGNTHRVYRLVRQVRFPQVTNSFVDMNEFDDAFTGREAVTTDVLALGIIDMRVRILYQGDYINVIDYGRATGGGGDFLEDNKSYLEYYKSDTDAWVPSWKNWSDVSGKSVKLRGGSAAPATRTGQSHDNNAHTITVSAAWPGGLSPQADTTYRIERLTAGNPENAETPTWLELEDPDIPNAQFPMIVVESFPGPSPEMDVRMPYVVEVTLELAHPRSPRFQTFMHRFYIPGAQQ